MDLKVILENQIDDLYHKYEQDKTNESLKAQFNAKQVEYKSVFKKWYNPARQVELSLWEQALPLPCYHKEECYNHE
jgi:hypothetical protein